MIVLVVCAGFVGALFTFVHVNWHLYSIPAASMEPTLRVGDHMMASKGPFEPAEIHRGEVIVFLNDGTSFVKRAIAVGGDQIQMVDGRVYLNGEALPTRQISDYETNDHRGQALTVRRLEESLDGRTYETLDMRDDAGGDNTRSYIVPENHLFVMGDNRDNSSDSRFGIGFVAVDDIVGIARTIYWSPKRGNHLGPVTVR